MKAEARKARHADTGRHKCPLERYTYSAKAAQAKADTPLVEPREGLDMTGREMEFPAREAKAGLEGGQSVHHIFASRSDLPCSERSFYRHVENEAIDVPKTALRKKAKYKAREPALTLPKSPFRQTGDRPTTCI